MNIDLLFSADHEAGLITNANFVQKAIGVTFDPAASLLTIEFADMDMLDMNIPLDQTFSGALQHCELLYLGAVIDGTIAQAYQVPLMFLDDPYRAEALGRGQHPQPLAAFNHFVKNCTIGQPVHRDDLDNDESMGCVLGEASPSALQFAPHLQRQHGLEIQPTAAPSAPGFNAPGLGSAGGGGHSRIVRRDTPPPKDDD